MRIIDINNYTKQDSKVLNNTNLFLVVKSQNQIERRERMIKSKKEGRYGRFKPSPTSIGLLVKGKLSNGQFKEEWKREFREPRHIRRNEQGNYYLTEINRLLEVDEKGNTIRAYNHPFFGYLHTVDISSDGNRALLVSSGYDSLIEIDLDTSNEKTFWCAWDHGFNPTKDGIWLTKDKEKYVEYINESKKAQYIDPNEFGEQGITTANRIAHPNAAIYDNKDGKSALVSIGHDGLLCKINLTSGEIENLYSDLTVMAHGIYHKDEGGVVITQTTRGEWLWLDSNYQEEIIYDFKNLGSKVDGVGDAEWIQQVVPISDTVGIAIDGNRGLIAFDTVNLKYSIYQHNENWCIQDLIIL